jgi:hypothetical protein
MLSVILSIILVVIAIPLIYLLAKAIGHGIKEFGKSVLICLMITSILELILFMGLLYTNVFVFMCRIGMDCNAIFDKFISLFFSLSIAIFVIVLCIYYAIKIIKKSLKIFFIILGICLILVAGFSVYNFQKQGTIDTTSCNIRSDCVLINSTGSLVAINVNYIKGWQEDIPGSFVQNSSCDYEATCVKNKCIVSNPDICES